MNLQVTPDIQNPFPGLTSYSEEYASQLLGREDAIDELLAKLRNTRFLAIVGGDAAGKSSLVLGGLIPALKQAKGAQIGTTWRVASCRPANNPIRSLAEALAKQGVLTDTTVDPDFAREIEQLLREGSNGIVDVLASSRFDKEKQLLISIDQFDDIFRFSNLSTEFVTDKSDIIAFVNLLLFASRQKDFHVCVTISMRTVYLGDCANFRGLPDAINEGQYLVPVLKQSDYRDIFRELGALGGIDLQSEDLQQLLSELQQFSEQLPAFQYAIYQTVEYWKEESPETLDLADYQAVGGINQAIATQAEKNYQSLTDREKEICAWLFRTILEHSNETQDRRRPTNIATIAVIAEVGEAEVMDVALKFEEFLSFIDANTNHSELAIAESIDAHTIIDVKYEVLITQWKRLQHWIEAEQQASETFLHLVNATEMYEQDRGGLYRDPELALARRWAEEERPNEAWASRYLVPLEPALEFLRVSYDRFVQEERQKEEEQASKLKRNRRITLIFIGVGIFGLVLSAFALYQRNKAHEAKEQLVLTEKAEDKRQREDSLRLVAKISELDEANKTALRERAAAKMNEASAERAKAIAERNARMARMAMLKAVKAQDEAEKAYRVASKSDSSAKVSAKIADRKRKEADSLQIISQGDFLLASAKSLAVTSLDELRTGEVESGEVLALMSYYINEKSGGPLQLDKIYHALRYAVYGQLDASLPANENLGHADGIVAVNSYQTNEGEQFISCGFSNIAIWKPLAYEPVKDKGYELKISKKFKMPDNVKGAAFLNNEGTVIAGCSNGEVYQIDVVSKKMEKLVQHEAPIMTVYQGKDFVAVFSATELSIIHQTKGLKTTKLPKQATNIAFAPTEKHFAIGGENYISLFRFEDDLTFEEQLSRPMSVRVTALAISPNQQYIAVGNYLGNIEVRSMHNLKRLSFKDDANRVVILKGHQSPISSLSFNPTSNLLASGSYDNSAKLWRFRQHSEEAITFRMNGWVKDVEFCQKGKSLLVVGADKITHFFETNLDDLADKLCTTIDQTAFLDALNPYKSSLKAAGKYPSTIDKCLQPK